jgi:hypothetical protein
MREMENTYRILVGRAFRIHLVMDEKLLLTLILRDIGCERQRTSFSHIVRQYIICSCSSVVNCVRTAIWVQNTGLRFKLLIIWLTKFLSFAEPENISRYPDVVQSSLSLCILFSKDHRAPECYVPLSVSVRIVCVDLLLPPCVLFVAIAEPFSAHSRLCSNWTWMLLIVELHVINDSVYSKPPPLV